MYLFEASYSPQGIEGIRNTGGSRRRDAVADLAAGLGGRLESFYFAFGDVDAYVTVELPDNDAATACALAVNSTGAASIKTVPLLTPEEVDAATKLSTSYRPPGR
ncbi:MAG TPA: GYD domain-containing protein [Solirubrobacterales bacterium]|jgi:uncharacterized protein with GYD domain